MWVFRMPEAEAGPGDIMKAWHFGVQESGMQEAAYCFRSSLSARMLTGTRFGVCARVRE